MKYNKEILNFWQTQGLDHIKPRVGGEFPEGWDVRDLLVEIIKDNTVNEAGCGYGRLASKFTPEQYRGFDVNPAAVKHAQELNPNYSFQVYEIGTDMPESDYVLFYTVLLHVPDENLVDMLRVASKNTKRIIVGEILGRRWRRAGNPPVFNREREDYVNAFA